MITEMWSKRYKKVITECQRKKLRSLAWRRLNNILPWRYLLFWCFNCHQNCYSSSNQIDANQLISFSVAVKVPTQAELPIDPNHYFDETFFDRAADEVDVDPERLVGPDEQPPGMAQDRYREK